MEPKAEYEQPIVVQRTDEFIKNQFAENPHFSFGDGSIMYEHSVMVSALAGQIADEVPEADRELIALGALLHDIGKTYHADEETLHKEHESFNVTVSESFLDTLSLSSDKLARLKGIISYTDDSPELQVIKDADAIALYADKRLYMLFVEWAVDKGHDWAIQRKIDKFDNLNFDTSKEIAKPLLETMKADWEEYQRQNKS